MKKENKVKENLQKYSDSQPMSAEDRDLAQFIIDADFIWKYSDRKKVIDRLVQTRYIC